MSSHGHLDEVPDLVLLGRFALSTNDGEFALSQSGQRLVALVALQPGPTTRERIAGRLWPEETHDRAGARLRTALSRVKQRVPNLIVVANGSLGLAADVAVDFRMASELGHRLVDLPIAGALDDIDIATFEHDLLPDWYDDWVVAERESFRQLRFTALETIALAALQAHQHVRAVQACLAVVGAEPLRESAQRLLMRAYAADGNVGEAMRQADHYAELLHDELGLSPSHLMIDLRDSLAAARG